MQPFRLGVVTKIWGRPAVAEFVMAYAAALPERVDVPGGLEVVCVAAVSPGDRHPPARPDGWAYVSAPNRPLSHKGNYAARALENHPSGRVDAVLNIGSDDVCSPAYVAACVEAVRGGADYVTPEGLVLWDLATARAVAVAAPRIGAGRVLSARLLDRLRWHPWPVRGNHPDADMDARLAEYGGEYRAVSVPGADVAAGLVVCDVKCGDNIGDYDTIATRRGARGETSPVALPDLLAALAVTPQEAEALKARHAAFRYANRLDAMDPARLRPTAERPVKVRALKTFTNRQEEGAVRRGAVFYATERRARDLARVGAAEILSGLPEAQGVPDSGPDGVPDGVITASEAGAALAAAKETPGPGRGRRPRKEEKAPEKRTKEEKAAPRRTTKEATPAEAEPAESSAPVSVDVSAYHVGGGWYEVPGVGGKVKGKEAAEKAAVDAGLTVRLERTD